MANTRQQQLQQRRQRYETRVSRRHALEQEQDVLEQELEAAPRPHPRQKTRPSIRSQPSPQPSVPPPAPEEPAAAATAVRAPRRSPMTRGRTGGSGGAAADWAGRRKGRKVRKPIMSYSSGPKGERGSGGGSGLTHRTATSIDIRALSPCPSITPLPALQQQALESKCICPICLRDEDDGWPPTTIITDCCRSFPTPPFVSLLQRQIKVNGAGVIVGRPRILQTLFLGGFATRYMPTGTLPLVPSGLLSRQRHGDYFLRVVGLFPRLLVC